MIKVGFCILSHNNPGQLQRLVITLNAVYDCPAIVCHHDESQSAIDKTSFPANVSFTSVSLRTGWGRSSVVRAGLLAIKELFDKTSSQWFVLLSASDYPVAPARVLYELIANSPYDAFADVRPLLIQSRPVATSFGSNDPALSHFDSDGNRRIKERFYLSPEFWVPILRLKPRLRVGRYTVRFPWTNRALLRSGYSVYYGDHWFMGNVDAAAALNSHDVASRFFLKYLSSRAAADECFFQSVLMNTEQLSICCNARRFARWNGGGAHPQVITELDISDIVSSGALFARKFAHDTPVLNKIDEHLLGIGS